jgi:hypothetical protein
MWVFRGPGAVTSIPLQTNATTTPLDIRFLPKKFCC